MQVRRLRDVHNFDWDQNWAGHALLCSKRSSRQYCRDRDQAGPPGCGLMEVPESYASSYGSITSARWAPLKGTEAEDGTYTWLAREAGAASMSSPAGHRPDCFSTSCVRPKCRFLSQA